MEMRHLRYFVAVAEELSFTRAARRLHIAQPPLSTQIRLLEEELETQLFERDKRHVFLTEAGRHFLERARGILADTESAKTEVRSAALGEIGRIVLGYTNSAMFLPALPRAVRSFCAKHPKVKVALHEMTSLDQLDAVHMRRLDLGILRRPNVAVPSGIVLEQWCEAPLLAAIPLDHPLSRTSVRIVDLRNQPLILYERSAGIGLYWKVLELCSLAGFRPHTVQEARDASTIIGLVAAGVGIAVVPDGADCIKLEGVVFKRLEEGSASSSLHFAYRQDDSSPHRESLLKELRLSADVSPGRPKKRDGELP
ncbi:transcriptional regulator, LysR family [Variovorax sp. OK212]|nr:transcriptional regulator, LysR family [Variovorax sp. OK212]